MSVLFNHACRHELFDRNPIKLVRQSAKRRTAPNVLTPAEIKLLLDNLALRERTLFLLAASAGLRQSELFTLKWSDIDFSQGIMNVTRSIAYGIVGRCKTEASQKPVPVHQILAGALIRWRDRCKYREPNDWLFANEHHRGRHPYWGLAYFCWPYVRAKVRPPSNMGARLVERGEELWLGNEMFRGRDLAGIPGGKYESWAMHRFRRSV